MKNSKLNTIIIVIVTAIVLFFALKDDFIEKINYLFSFNILWLIFAIILVFTEKNANIENIIFINST